MSELSKYSKALTEGFSKCKEYIQDKHWLQEKASLALKDSFSIDSILSYCMDKDKFKDLSFNDRKMFAKELFEIYFDYSKNILLYFEIYSQKSITEHTPQIVNYLSKIPNFSDHLELIGYHYQSDFKEWKYIESNLTRERKQILQFITVCSCLGYSYLDEPLKFLSLTIFEEREKLFRDFMKDRLCEYCNSELDLNLGRCSVCTQDINTMAFVIDCIFKYSIAVKDEKPYVDDLRNYMKDERRIIKEISVSQSLPVNDLEIWKCTKCTLDNSVTSLSCNACFELKENKPVIEDLQKCVVNNFVRENNLKDFSTLQNELTNVKDDRKIKVCSKCTLNYDTYSNCPICFNSGDENETKYIQPNIYNYNDPIVNIEKNIFEKPIEQNTNYQTFVSKRNENKPFKVQQPERTVLMMEKDVANEQISFNLFQRFVNLLIGLVVIFILFLRRKF